MKNETIEQKTYRLLQIANKNDVGVAIDSDFVGKMFKGLLDNSIFKLHCKMIELAIAEEREANAKICDEKHWDWSFGSPEEESSTSGPKECAAAIRQRAAPKDEVSE